MDEYILKCNILEVMYGDPRFSGSLLWAWRIELTQFPLSSLLLSLLLIF